MPIFSEEEKLPHSTPPNDPLLTEFVEALATIERNVETYGHACVYNEIAEARPAYAYTVGLQSGGWGELVLTSLQEQESFHLLNHVVARLRDLERAPFDGMVVDKALSVPVVLKALSDEASLRYLKAANFRSHRYGGPYPVDGFQVVLPDTEGKFPWDEDKDPNNFPFALFYSR